MDPNTGGRPSLPASVTPPRGYVLSGKIMLSVIVVLLAIAMFVLFLHVYVRCHVLRRHDRRRRRRNRLIFASDDPNSNPSAPRRLDSEVLNSLPVEVFSDRDADDVEEAECAVCISGFGEGEKVRVVPPCGHRFHVDCIDMWFRSHSTCPLCRCAVEAVIPLAPETVSVSDPAVSELAVSDPVPWNREARIEMPEESDSGSESTSAGVVPVKLPGHRRISSFRRFLIGIQISNQDLERGEPLDRVTPPPPPPPPNEQ